MVNVAFKCLIGGSWKQESGKEFHRREKRGKNIRIEIKLTYSNFKNKIMRLNCQFTSIYNRKINWKNCQSREWVRKNVEWIRILLRLHSSSFYNNCYEYCPRDSERHECIFLKLWVKSQSRLPSLCLGCSQSRRKKPLNSNQRWALWKQYDWATFLCCHLFWKVWLVLHKTSPLNKSFV